MNGVEALWAVHFGGLYIPGQHNGGVVVLETTRIFGGDSCFYYVGKYDLTDNKLTAQVRITHFNGPNKTAFGTSESDPYDVEFEGVLDGNSIDGEIWKTDDPNDRLSINLLRLENLP